MSRPRKEIDFDQFEKLCALHCTLFEIAGWFGVSEDTIERRVSEEYGQTFAEVFQQKRAGGRISIRRKMMEVAMGGSVPMLIFMSKNLLGFGDRVITETGAENNESKLVIQMHEDAAKEAGK